MKLTLAEAAMGANAALEAPSSIPHAGELIAKGYSIDSRTLQSGDLFFAIHGERFDGHDFVSAAIERGAIAAVVARAQLASLPDAALAAPLLVVDDTLLALQSLASLVRRQWGKRLVAVTGSAGKTTTKDAIAAALSAKFNVHKSEGNLNNGFGLPLQLLKLEPEHEYAVIEMGMNHAGEIQSLARIATPDWGVVTNVGTAHIESFPDGQDGIARAKFELIAALPQNGVAFLNCDDPYVAQFGRNFPGRVFYFGAAPSAVLQTTSVTEDETGVHAAFHWDGQAGAFTLPMVGMHNATNALAAMAVAIEAGVDPFKAALAIESLKPGDKRGETLAVNGVTILNDCYNSNPEALKSMIRSLASRKISSGGRRILVAGEMLELGAQGPALHTSCGRAAVEAGLDLVVGVRGNAEHLAAAACSSGVSALFLADAEAAGKWMSENLRKGDLVLLKGSRGVKLEQALSIYLDHKSN